MKNNNEFKIINEDKMEITCNVLFTFDSDETKKSYIVYTDNTLDENNKIKTYASIYDPNKEDSPLIPIKTKKEWEIIENILNSLENN